MKRFAVVVLLVALVGCSSNSKKVDLVAPVPAPKGNLVPNKEWLDDYHQMRALGKEVQDIEKNSGLKEKRDLLLGKLQRLQNTSPQGYVWDERSESFAPSGQIIAPQQPAPVVAPQAGNVGVVTPTPVKK